MALRYVCSDDSVFADEAQAQEHEESIVINDPLYKFIDDMDAFICVELQYDVRRIVYYWILDNWKPLQTIMYNRKEN